MTTTYPIIANCNFESREDNRGRAIHKARLAVECGLCDDADLIAALDDLEATLSEHAEDGCEDAVRACRDAEDAVAEAWSAVADDVAEARYS